MCQSCIQGVRSNFKSLASSVKETLHLNMYQNLSPRAGRQKISYQDCNNIYVHISDKLWTFLLNMDYCNTLSVE